MPTDYDPVEAVLADEICQKEDLRDLLVEYQGGCTDSDWFLIQPVVNILERDIARTKAKLKNLNPKHTYA